VCWEAGKRSQGTDRSGPQDIQEEGRRQIPSDWASVCVMRRRGLRWGVFGATRNGRKEIVPESG